MSQYLTISELSKKYTIPVSTLRFYQRNGLLTPVKHDENNYGYYSVNQIPFLDLITFFRELDLPVRTIQEIIDCNLDHDAIMQILAEHRDSLQQEVQELSLKINKINQTEKLYQRISSSSLNPGEMNVYIRHFETRWFIVRKLNHPMPDTAEEWHLNIRRLNAPILETANSSNPIYSMGVIQKLADVHTGHYTAYHAAFMECVSCPDERDLLEDFDLVTLEPGDYLAIRFLDASQNREEAYNRLISHIRSHNISTAEDVYDGIINCYLPPVKHSPHIYELHVKLK